MAFKITKVMEMRIPTGSGTGEAAAHHAHHNEHGFAVCDRCGKVHSVHSSDRRTLPEKCAACGQPANEPCVKEGWSLHEAQRTTGGGSAAVKDNRLEMENENLKLRLKLAEMQAGQPGAPAQAA